MARAKPPPSRRSVPEDGLVEGILGVVHLREHAQVQAVVGHGLEVEGAALKLDLVAAGVLDRLALAKR